MKVKLQSSCSFKLQQKISLKSLSSRDVFLCLNTGPIEGWRHSLYHQQWWIDWKLWIVCSHSSASTRQHSLQPGYRQGRYSGRRPRIRRIQTPASTHCRSTPEEFIGMSSEMLITRKKMKTMKQKILLCKQEVRKKCTKRKNQRKFSFQQLNACSSQERSLLSHPYNYHHMQVLWLYQFFGWRQRAVPAYCKSIAVMFCLSTWLYSATHMYTCLWILLRVFSKLKWREITS